MPSKFYHIATLTLCLTLQVIALKSGEGPLYGTFTPVQQTFTDLNYWVNTWNSPVNPMNMAVGVVNVGWSANGTAADMQAILSMWNDGTAVPIVTWMPYPYATWTSPTPNLDIVNGTYDTYIDGFFTALASFLRGPDDVMGTDDDRRAFLRFAPQPNGNWFPWSPQCAACYDEGQHINQTVASYLRLWAYCIGKSRLGRYNMSRDVLRVVFDVNNVDAYGVDYKMEDFFPDPSTVDWLAITGVNWGNTLPGNKWESPSDLFDGGIKRLMSFNDGSTPLMISGGTTSHPNGAWAKYWWIVAFFDYVISIGGRVLLYHNGDSSTDIACFGGEGGLSKWTSPLTLIQYNVYQSFADTINNKTYGVIGSNYSNPRLISDKQFAGQ